MLYMSEGLQFNDEVNHALKMAYQTPDIVATRAKVVTTLNLKSGQRVLDIGSGPGLLARDIAQQLDGSGYVVGVDTASNMIATAQLLCANLPTVTFQQGDAMSLPFDYNSFDAVVSTQVFEYVPDLDDALAEFARVLCPGGRGVIVDTDWAVPYWNASDAVLHGRMIKAWKGHCAQESVPLRLSASIRGAGLKLEGVQALPISNISYNENNFSFWLSKIIASFAVGRDGLTQRDSNEWVASLEALEEKGAYLFCINRYMFEITK